MLLQNSLSVSKLVRLKRAGKPPTVLFLVYQLFLRPSRTPDLLKMTIAGLLDLLSAPAQPFGLLFKAFALAAHLFKLLAQLRKPFGLGLGGLSFLRCSDLLRRPASTKTDPIQPPRRWPLPIMLAWLLGSAIRPHKQQGRYD
ncbi:MAG: hypothetical protein SPK00_06555 [Corynebacterium glucuronolyticum]|nr:hypothetical protein [Corynebacterium glucuronolyticum]MDD7586200.1 hypothetical protein [Mycobacteriaceae bacterium]MDY5834392.1 hypothetical protein [Corynebacterium glucuronolyticum]